MQGKFGAERPDGGIWRGIVLRAQAGTTVRAVAPGRVVFASWMTGFGNLLIIDHGRDYLSVYAYNQSTLKQVGDIVGRGDAVARVGATGGQVEPGLYFELRHQGKPINPQVWLGS
jgi:septal ring factor EnvC (AmiA/AmiB activator)